MIDSSPAQILADGIDQLAIELDQPGQEKLLQYLALLLKWNRAFNLTAVRTPHEMVRKHLLDSLSVLPYVEATPLLDVGTGPGLPGIPLAICRPEQSFFLLDSNGKKTRFVKQAVAELGLGNVEVVHARVEAYRNVFPQIICRAFSSLAQTLELLEPLLVDGGKVLAMKGAVVERELQQLLASIPGHWQLHNHPLNVPGLDEQRYLVECRRAVTGDAAQTGAKGEKQ